MPPVKMYCTAVCPYCIMAEKLLNKKGVSQIEKIRIEAAARCRRSTSATVTSAASTTFPRWTRPANWIPCWPPESHGA